MQLDDMMNIAHAWLPAFREKQCCEKLLYSMNVRAFSVYRNFLYQFAESEHDIELHNTLYLELCRSAATSAHPLSFHRDKFSHRYYRSPLVDQIRFSLAKRDGFDNVASWLSSSPPRWRTEIDPLQRQRYRLAAFEDRDVFSNYREIFLQESRIAIEEEASRFVTGPTGSFLPSNRSRLFIEHSLPILQDIGFKPVAPTLQDYAALDLHISRHYVLRWSVGDDAHFFFDNPEQANCKPLLCLRPRSFTKRIKDAKGVVYLEFPFTMLVEGIDQVYTTCHDSKEICLSLQTQASIARWLTPYIVEAISGSVDDLE